MDLRKRADPHDRRGDRNLRRLHEAPQFIAGVAADDATTAVKHRPLGLFDQADDLVQFNIARPPVWIITAQRNLLRVYRLRLLLLNILGHIDDYGTRTAGARD